MEIIIKATPEEASRYAFEKIRKEMERGAKVLGLATGSTPERLYRIMRESDLDFSGMTSINLDEYMGLSEDNPQSYHYFMHKHLFDAKPFKKNYLLDGLADETEECAQFEEIIAANPIDVQILGIGTNGHIGFNEPGTSFDSRTQKVALWQSTIDSNKRYFADEKDVPRFAYSMGIQSILSSRKIILMAFGKEKAAAVKAALEGPITEDLPASILQTHKHVTVILDEAAAQMLSKK
jgi:glucosamine-6-phosphate deaminase